MSGKNDQGRTSLQEDHYQVALAMVQQLGGYFLNRRDPSTGEWYIVGPRKPICGLERAQEALEQYKKAGYDGDPSDLRVVPEIVAQTTREVWNAVEEWLTRNGIAHPPLHRPSTL
jgi:hypothetical protein